MTTISTHMLDSVAGGPAEGVGVSLATPSGQVLRAMTDTDGRVRFAEEFAAGIHTLTFQVGHWSKLLSRSTLFPEITLEFEIAPGEAHYHLAVLFAGNAYTAYRGS